MIGAMFLAVFIFGCDYFGMPGYIVALVCGIWGGAKILSKNQRGKIRKKIPTTVAFAFATAVCVIVRSLDYSIYFGAIIFVGASFSLIRLNKSKAPVGIWLLEITPAVLYFVSFERLGRGISGLGRLLTLQGFGINIHYIEAFMVLTAFAIVQAKSQKYPHDHWEPVIQEMKGFKTFSKVVIAIAAAIIWFNPANMIVIDNMKNGILDALSGTVSERSAVATISDSNGTTLLHVKSQESVTDEQMATQLLLQYDEELSVEYRFVSRESLPDGNVVYKFAQVHDGIRIFGRAKNLVVNSAGRPLYIVGEPKLAALDRSLLSGEIGKIQAENLVRNYFVEGRTEIGDVLKVWNGSSGIDGTAYRLSYVVSASVSSEDSTDINYTLLVDAISGAIANVAVLDADGKALDALSPIVDDIKANAGFSEADFVAIRDSVDRIAEGIEMNAWLYQAIFEAECRNYYANKGDEKLGEKNVSAIKGVFKDIGVDGENKDEGVVSVDMKESKVTVNGKVNFAYDKDEILVSHNSMDTQQYSVKTDVPFTLTVTKRNGELILSIPIFDEKTFEIYPSGQNEQYVFTIQGDSSYQASVGKVSAPSMLNTLFIQPLAATSLINWFSKTEQASYSLSVEKIKSDARIKNGATINKMLERIAAVYNAGNGSSFLALYRFDETEKSFQENYYDQVASKFGRKTADNINKAMNSHSLGVYAQMGLIYYRVYNTVLETLASSHSKLNGLRNAVSDNPDKTFIALVLFGFHGNVNNWSNDFMSALLELDGSTLSFLLLVRQFD